MSRWGAHRATFICLHHNKTARAMRALAFERKAPCCPTCGLPMQLLDTRGISNKAHDRLISARLAQIEYREALATLKDKEA